MPAAIAIPIAMGIGTAGGAAIAGGLQASAAKSAAKTQSDAASHAADLQAKAAADALAFQKQQAAQDLAQANAIQQANYNQWAAKERSMSNFGQMLGLPGRDIPAYQPIPNTLGGSTPSGDQAAGQPTLPSAQTTANMGNLSDPNAWMSLVGNSGKLDQWIQSQAPWMSPQLRSYYAGVITKQPGATPTEQAGSAQYYIDKFAKDPNNPRATGSATPTLAPASFAAFLPQVQAPQVLTPALQAPNTYANYLR